MATTPYDPFRINNVASEVQRPAQQLAGCGKGNEAPVIPPGYKQTEVGVIPTDWCVDALGPHVDITSGESPSRFRFTSGGIPYFKVDQINNNSKYLSDTPYFIRENRKVSRGSLIFPKRGASILLNKVRILAEDSFMDTNLMALTARASVHPEFLYYALTHIELWRIADTTSIPQINNKHIVPLLVPLPPTLAEQRAIAEALSDVDKLLGSLEKFIAKKRAIKQAAMQQLLTGKTRLPGFSRAWGKKRTEVGIIPRDWECLRLGDVVNLLTGFPFPSSGYTNSGVLLVRGSNVKRGVLDWDDDITRYWPTIDSATKQYELRKRDLVIAMDGALVGRSYAVISDTDLPSLLLQRVARIRSSQVHQDLLAFLVAGDPFINHVDAVKTHTAIPHISPDDIRNFLVAIPTNTAEQCAIATILSDMDAEIAALERRRDKTRAIKQGMMQQLLTGRIRLFSDREGNDRGL